MIDETESIHDVFSKVDKEIEEYFATFGKLSVSFDMDALNKNDVPQNALIEIERDGVVFRATESIDSLLKKLTSMKNTILEADYPKWLDERHAHLTSDGTLIRVDEVRYRPDSYKMYAFVSLFDMNMRDKGMDVVEITGKTDRKALARKLAEGSKVDVNEARCGYVIWRRVA